MRKISEVLAPCRRCRIFWVISIICSASLSHASCDVIKGGVKTVFDGKSLQGIAIEKKSLIIFNREFPSFNAVERTLKGDVRTCTGCKDNYVTCHDGAI